MYLWQSAVQKVHLVKKLKMNSLNAVWNPLSIPFFVGTSNNDGNARDEGLDLHSNRRLSFQLPTFNGLFQNANYFFYGTNFPTFCETTICSTMVMFLNCSQIRAK